MAGIRFFFSFLLPRRRAAGRPAGRTRIQAAHRQPDEVQRPTWRAFIFERSQKEECIALIKSFDSNHSQWPRLINDVFIQHDLFVVRIASARPSPIRRNSLKLSFIVLCFTFFNSSNFA